MNTKQQALKAIKDFWRKKHYSPSLRDIIATTDISSTSHCQIIINQLAEEGLITFDTDKKDRMITRSIVVNEPGGIKATVGKLIKQLNTNVLQ